MRRILIAEDDMLLGGVYEILLEEAGFEVLWRRDGQEALEAFDDFAPDLLITDNSMPRMTGAELMRAVEGRGARVMMVSASDPRMLQVEPDLWLEKPVTPARLLSAVRAMERSIDSVGAQVAA
ncbi:response regulator [Caulobacter hibisci]|uniref:Response regulator transcription factor n=1 Tax=Caulobacter hibisci TaxID=2035993 RepID=A0ABS0SW75_9CAUL|nr:response regulator [Caulobacter hibisci]MBI1682948.1 response regulator transcription factor [Caulobacter hibisci]